jgi:uncharacterized protein YjbI with pentapeptide repeats
MIKQRVIITPSKPKLLPKPSEWAGTASTELELEGCLVRDRDFAAVRRLEVEGCRLVSIEVVGATFDKLQMSDAVVSRLEAAGMRAPESSWLRIRIEDSRLTGVDIGAATFEDCTFRNVKINEAGLRFAALKRVRFENCVLRNTEFNGAKLSQVSFDGCDLEGANFDGATCKSVDLRGEPLIGIKGVHGLRGAIISSEQLMQLAPLLASEAGLDVDYET